MKKETPEQKIERLEKEISDLKGQLRASDKRTARAKATNSALRKERQRMKKEKESDEKRIEGLQKRLDEQFKKKASTLSEEQRRLLGDSRIRESWNTVFPDISLPQP